MSNTPIGRLKYKVDSVNYSVLTVWQGDKGLSISMDKHSEKYPAMNPIQVLKRWATGAGFLNYYPADPPAQRSPQTIDGPRAQEPDPFSDDDIPF